jgi:sugar phosphate isomerase/epimerase
MGLTRRQLLAASAFGASRAAAQFRPGNGPKIRSTPAVCLYSQLLVKIPYDDLGPVVRTLGLDGVDLSVQKGGHINPDQSSVDMMRGVEAITGVGLDVPCITTAYTNIADPTIRNVMAISGEMGVPVMRTGVWKYSDTVEPEIRLGEVQRDMIGLMSYARAVRMSIAFPNVAGDNVGASTWDINMMIRGMDAQSVGYAFDPANAALNGGWTVPLRLALPRLKMIAVRDFTWVKDPAGPWKAAPCPLGEGIMDWPKFFAVLGRAKFNGPISIHIDYQPKDDLAAIRHDVDFIRKQIAAAYAGGGQ